MITDEQAKAIVDAGIKKVYPFEYYFYVQLVCPAGSTGAECQALLDTLTPVCSTLRLLGAFTLDGTEK